jgi:hypothetical protein
MSEFERELEQELHRVLDAASARPIPPRRPIPYHRTAKTLLGGAGAALAVKVLGGVAVAAAAITVAGVATTDSLNPVDWGQQVKHQISNDATTPTNPAQHGNGNGNANGDSNANGGSTGIGGKHLASPNSQPTMGPEPAEPVGPGGPGGPVPHKQPGLMSPPPYVNASGS